jgi:hypothetical protein
VRKCPAEGQGSGSARPFDRNRTGDGCRSAYLGTTRAATAPRETTSCRCHRTRARTMLPSWESEIRQTVGSRGEQAFPREIDIHLVNYEPDSADRGTARRPPCHHVTPSLAEAAGRAADCRPRAIDGCRSSTSRNGMDAPFPGYHVPSEKGLARALWLIARSGKDDAPSRVPSTITQETLSEMIRTTRSQHQFVHEQVQKAGIHRYRRRPSRSTIRS